MKLRYVTEITKDNIRYCKEMLTFSEIRHLDGMKGNFEVADQKEYVATATLDKTKSIPQLIFCNLPEIVEQQQFVFNSFWNRAIPSEQKMKEIEGITPDLTIIIPDYKESEQKEFEMIKKAKKEIQIMYFTSNAFPIQERGILQLLTEKVMQEKQLPISILTPIDNTVKRSEGLKRLKNYSNNIRIQNTLSDNDIKIKTLVLDREESLVIELKHTNGEKTTVAIGKSVYSNSKPLVLSYHSIFESLWMQTEMYEQQRIAHEKLELHEKMQREFINIAAHEIRTPTQKILGYLEMAEAYPDERVFVGNAYRNAVRLQRLTEDLLHVARAESNILRLNKERLDLNELVLSIVTETQNLMKKKRGKRKG